MSTTKSLMAFCECQQGVRIKVSQLDPGEDVVYSGEAIFQGPHLCPVCSSHGIFLRFDRLIFCQSVVEFASYDVLKIQTLLKVSSSADGSISRDC